MFLVRVNRRAVALISIFVLMLGLFYGPGASFSMADQLQIIPDTLPAATQGVYYDQTLSVIGGSGPFTWSIVNGDLPSGLNLNEELGSISGIPAQAGNYPFTLGVANAVYQSVYDYNLLVNEPPNLFLPPVPANYENYFPMCLDEDSNDIWSADQNLNLKLFRLDNENNPSVRTLIMEYSNTNGLLVDDTSIHFSLPPKLNPAQYKVEVYNDSNLIAQAEFSIQLHNLAVKPQQIFSGYNEDMKITLYNYAPFGLWYPRESDLSLKLYSAGGDNDDRHFIKGFSLAPSSVGGNSITFTLPPALHPGYYQIDLLKSARLIASSSFNIDVHRVNINPPTLSNNYSASQTFTLSEDPLIDVWSAADILSIEIWNNKTSEPAPTPLAVIPVESLSVNENEIGFTAPAGLTDGEYSIKVMRTRGSLQEFIGCTGFGVFPPVPRVDIQYDYLQEGYEGPRSASLIEPQDQADLWTAGDSVQIKVYEHIPNTAWAPYNFTPVTGNTGIVSVSDTNIDFSIPAGLHYGQYMVLALRDGNKIAHAIFQIDRSLLALNGGPDILPLGYDPRIQMSVFIPPNTPIPWSPDGTKPWAWLIAYDTVNDRWNDLAPVDVFTPGPNELRLSIPAGLPIGTYRFIIGNNSGPQAYKDFRVELIHLDTNPWRFEAGNSEPINIKLFNGNQIWNPEGVLTYTLLKWVQNNYNAEFNYQETNITGSVSILPDNNMALTLPANMESGDYLISISQNQNEIATANITFDPLMSRIKVREIYSYRSAQKVKVPVVGQHVYAASGVQFTINFDSNKFEVSSINEHWDIVTSIPNASIAQANVNNGTGQVTVVVTTNDGSTFSADKLELCSIGFNVSAPVYSYNNLSIDGSSLMLSDQEGNAIPVAFEDGFINVCRSGDLNQNNRVDVGDAILLLRHLANLAPLDTALLSLADVDGDAGISVTDAMLVLQKVVDPGILFPDEMILH